MNGHRTRILTVDDDELQLRALKRAARLDDRVDLVAFNNATDAQLSIDIRSPDLIVVDVLMPGTDGIELCRRITTDPATQNIPVILANLDVTPQLEALAFAAGAAGVIPKPITIEKLIGPPTRTAVAA